MAEDFDVLVIGAGFAGMTAARELTQRGRSVVVLEGRDRIGGRTWTDNRLGRDIELGGTWVHPVQPHVWAELTRYGLGTVPSPDPERILVADSGGTRELSPEAGMRALAIGLDHIAAGAREAMPHPFDALEMRDVVMDLDRRSVADQLETLKGDADCQAIAASFVATGYQAPADEISLAHAVRIASLCYWDAVLDLEAASTFKIDGGTRALIEAIAGDSTADVRLGTTVASLTSRDGVVTAVTGDGGEYRAAAAVVTVPINALRGITFDPPLAPAKQAVVEAGQTSRGVKVWARLRGAVRPFLGFADPEVSPLHIVQYEYEVDGDTLVVAFGSDATAISVDDREAVEVALRRWLPDAEVVAVAGHDWTGDEFSRETWCNLRPGQLSEGVPHLQQVEQGIHFAGSDYSGAWLGYIDGAVETGLRAARSILSSAQAVG